MARSFLQGVCAVLGLDDRIKGTAFAALPQGLFLTCAHVYLDALQLPRDSAQPPSTGVRLLSQPGAAPIPVELAAWSPVAESDVTVLRAPDAAGLLPRSLHQVEILQGIGFESYGFPAGYHTAKYFGRAAGGTIGPEIRTGLLQVEAPGVTFGFSGAPLVDLQMGRTVGMLVTSDPPYAFAVPAAAIARVARRAGLPFEILQPSRPFHLLTQGLEGAPGDVLERCESLLAYYLGDATAPAAFCGRDTEMSALDRWLTDDSSPCALIAEPAGRGKTALLVKWASAVAASGIADVAFVPVSNRFNTARLEDLAQIWSARLALFASGAAAAPSTANALADVYNRLRNPRAPGEPLLLSILDGADEAINWTLGRDVVPPVFPPARVKILVSARQLAGDDGPQGWLDRLHWNAATTVVTIGQLSRADLVQFLASAPAWLRQPYAVDGLYHLSDNGDPLLLRLLVEKFEKKPPMSEAQLAREKPGYQGYFKSWWQDQRQAWKEQGLKEHPKAKAVRRAIAAALGPLDRDELARLVRADPEDVSDAVAQLERHVVGDGVHSGWVFSHPRLRDYFREEMGPAQRSLRDKAFSTLVLQALAAAEKGRPADVSRYSVQFCVAHLERAGAGLAAYRKLASEGWLRAWQTLDPVTYTGYEQDVAAAWQSAEAHGDIALMFRCALIHCMTHAMSTVPAAFLPLLVDEGIATVEEALTLVRRSGYEPHQAESLEALIPALRTPNDFALVLALSERLPDERFTVRLLARLIPMLSPPIRQTAIPRACAIARKLAPEDHAEYMARLYPYLDPELQPTALSAALESLEKAYWKNSIPALAALMHVVPEDQAVKFWKQAVDNVGNLDDGDTADAALYHLLRHAPPALLPNIDDTAVLLFSHDAHYNLKVSGLWQRIRILRLALPHLSPHNRSTCFLPEYVDKLDEPGVSEFVGAGLLDFDEAPEAFATLDTIRNYLAGRTDEMAIATRIELIARDQDPQGLYLREVLAAIPGFDQYDAITLLTALAQALPQPITRQQYGQILVQARHVRHAMADLCGKVPPAWRAQAVLEALACRRQADRIDYPMGQMALRLSPSLPASRRPQIRRFLSALTDLRYFARLATEMGAIEIPEDLLDLIAAAADSSGPNVVAELKTLARLAVNRELKSAVLEVLNAKAPGLDVGVMALRTELAPPDRRAAMLRLPLETIPRTSPLPAAADVLSVAKLMEPGEGSAFALGNFLARTKQRGGTSQNISELQLLAKTFPDTLAVVVDKAAELPPAQYATALQELADAAPSPAARLSLLVALLALPCDDSTRLLARAKRLTFTSGVERRQEADALAAGWHQLQFDHAARALAAIAGMIDPDLYRGLALQTVDRFLKEAHKTANFELYPLCPGLIRLSDLDRVAAVSALSRIFHALAGFTEAMIIVWSLQLYPVMEHMVGKGIALRLFDDVVEVRGWWTFDDHSLRV